MGNMPSGMATEPMLTALFTRAVSSCEGFDPALGPPVLSAQMCGGGTCTSPPEPQAAAVPDEVRSHCAPALASDSLVEFRDVQLTKTALQFNARTPTPNPEGRNRVEARAWG